MIAYSLNDFTNDYHGYRPLTMVPLLEVYAPYNAPYFNAPPWTGCVDALATNSGNMQKQDQDHCVCVVAQLTACAVLYIGLDTMVHKRLTIRGIAC